MASNCVSFNDIKTEDIINEIENFSPIWNLQRENYTNKVVKHNVWEVVEFYNEFYNVYSMKTSEYIIEPLTWF